MGVEGADPFDHPARNACSRLLVRHIEGAVLSGDSGDEAGDHASTDLDGLDLQAHDQTSGRVTDGGSDRFRDRMAVRIGPDTANPMGNAGASSDIVILPHQ